MPKPSSTPCTLRDVARLAGVSIGTVSAVINNKGTAGAEAKKRVEDAMARLDYRPDTLARALKTGRSHAVGLVVPDVTNPFFTDAMAGIEAMARSRGYSVLLCNSNEDPDQELRNLKFLQSRRVDGVVLACASGNVAYDPLILRRCPIVLMDRVPASGYSGRAVLVDNVEAAATATKHLIGLGHTRIAIIGGRMDLTVGSGRLAGFRKAHDEAGLPIREEYVQHGDFHAESGYQCGMKLMSLREPPTAIFACNNSMTLGVMRALAQKGVPCPDRASVLAFDDFPWAEYFTPQLTTVAQPVFELGRNAMRLLFAAVEPDVEPELKDTKQIVLKAELRIRQSTARPPRAAS